MDSIVPTEDEAFGAPPQPIPRTPATLPTEEEAFGPSRGTIYVTPQQMSRIQRAEFERSMTNIFNAFGYSAQEAFGREPIATPYNGALSPETQEYLRKHGIFNDWSSGQRDVFKGLVESSFKTAASWLALAGRTFHAGLTGAAGAAGQALEESSFGLVTRGREQLEGLPADPGFAMLFPLSGPFTTMANARRAANLRVHIGTARANGVLAEGEAG